MNNDKKKKKKNQQCIVLYYLCYSHMQKPKEPLPSLKQEKCHILGNQNKKPYQ